MVVVARSLELLADTIGFEVVELWEYDDEFISHQHHRCSNVFTAESIKQDYPGVPTEPYLSSTCNDWPSSSVIAIFRTLNCVGLYAIVYVTLFMLLAVVENRNMNIKL